MARTQAPRLTLRAVIEKFAAARWWMSTCPRPDGRELVLPKSG